MSGMNLKQLLWLIISTCSIVMISFGQQVGVLFNSTLIVDNSTINWNNYNVCQCAILSTVMNETCYPQAIIEVRK